MNPKSLWLKGCLSACGVALIGCIATNAQTTNRGQQLSIKQASKADIISYPTPPDTVQAMLRLGRLTRSDVLYDLGSGDGRIPIAAAKLYGVRSIGIEIRARLVAEARRNAQREGVAHLVAFKRADMFKTSLRGATVVTLYLSNALNLSLLPKLLRELPTGARIVSHDFRFGNWQSETTAKVEWREGARGMFRTVRVWSVPPPAQRAQILREARRSIKTRFHGDGL